MSDLFRQAVVLTRLPVTGWYRYRGLFQILPPKDDFTKPKAMVGHHPLIFQWKYQAPQSVEKEPGQPEMPQWVHENDASGAKAREIFLVLGVFLNSRLFEYQGKQSWFLPLDESHRGSMEPLWGQEFYTVKDFSSSIDDLSDVDDIGEIARVESNTYFNRYAETFDAVFDIPEDLDFLLDAYFGLDTNQRERFLSACALFEKGSELWGSHPSLSFIAFVSSLETLINLEHEDEEVKKCGECGQDRYRVTKKFRDFFAKYGSDSLEFKKYSMKIYQYRSKVVHTGELFVGEVIPERFGSHDRIFDDDFRRSVTRTVRICIANWILGHGLKSNQ